MNGDLVRRRGGIEPRPSTVGSAWWNGNQAIPGIDADSRARHVRHSAEVGTALAICHEHGPLVLVAPVHGNGLDHDKHTRGGLVGLGVSHFDNCARATGGGGDTPGNRACGKGESRQCLVARVAHRLAPAVFRNRAETDMLWWMRWMASPSMLATQS